MMAHHVSAHALSTALPHRSSSYPSQDEFKTARHIPILSVPEILDAFHPAHSQNPNAYSNSVFRPQGADPWELPELKWLDAADHVVLGSCENLPVVDKYSDQSLTSASASGDKVTGTTDGGEKWPFPALYPGDRVAAAHCGNTLDDCFAQFSLPPMMNLSPADSGTSALTKNVTSSTRRTSTPDNVGRDFQHAVSQPQQQQQQQQHTSEWRRSQSSKTYNSAAASQLGPATSEKPDSDLSQGKSKSDRSNDSSKAGVFDTYLQGTASSSDVTALAVPNSRSEKKRKLQSGISASCNAGSSKPMGSTAGGQGSDGDTKISSVDRRLMSGRKSAAIDRNGSSSREVGKSAAAAAVPVTTAAAAFLGGISASPAVTAASEHDIHIWTERERRKKMNGMFSTLHALLPHLTTKADKATIVDEAIKHIRSLQVKMDGLQMRKRDAAASEVLIPSSSLAVLQASTTQIASSSSTSGEGVPHKAIQPIEAIPLCGDVDLDIKPSAAAIHQTNNSTSYGQQQQDGAGEAQEFQTLSTPNVVLNVCGIDVLVTICSPRGNPGLLCRVLFAFETHGLQVLNAHISATDDTAIYNFHTQTADTYEFSKLDTRKLALRDFISCLSKPDSFTNLPQQQPAGITFPRCNGMVQMTTTATTSAAS